MKLLEDDEVCSSLLSSCSLKEKNFGLVLPIWGFAYRTTVFKCSQDETMHSGVDVEAFQAALNRDIGGDVSASQFPGSDPGICQFYSSFSVQY